MNGPEIRRLKDGSISMVGLQTWFAATLLELPDHLVDDGNEKVRRRLYPDPSADEKQKAEWDRLVRPELFALVASAREIVMRDLEAMKPARGKHTERNLKIPAKHVSAWISALQVARLSLGARHDLGEAEMEGRVEELEEERQIALAKIHLLAWIQELLIDTAEEEEDQPG